MRLLRLAALCGTALAAMPVQAAEESVDGDDIIVTGARASTKTDTPAIEVPQPVTTITADQYLSQGAISISDTVKYAAGVLANPYGRDTRVDGFNIRGIDALQFRDGMRDIFSYYASITSDPYNFERVEIVRGPASVLYGQGSIGGLVNLVSKTPGFETGGEISATYGSYDRKELFGDVNVAASDTLAFRLVGHARDADTYVDHVADDRVMFAPSIRWKPTPDTDVVLNGLYQEDDGGSTSQFLPIVGTFRPNTAYSEGRLDPYTFVGKPGWDTYSGRSLQGSGSVTHAFSDHVRISLKARYIDSDLDYNYHGVDAYTNPTDPFLPYAQLGTYGRTIGMSSSASRARMNVFSTDNNVQFTFDTGAQIEHKLLAGVDYSWNKVSRQTTYGAGELVDLYDIDYDAISAYEPTGPFVRESQKQLGFYLQDQIRFFDRVSVVLGGRRDRVTSSAGSTDHATTFRAGIIGELGAGFSPFFSYTESFLPIAGSIQNADGTTGGAYRPQTGTQYEAGFKWQPQPSTLVTLTAFHIEERNRVLYLANNATTQSGKLTTKGIEIEASHTLPSNFALLVNYGYNKSKASESIDYMPRHIASAWTTKTFGVTDGAQLRLGAGVVYTGKRRSVGPAWTIITPDYTTVDALAEITWDKWRFALNATNLLDKRFYASCLARGDCFVGAPRNVMGTVGLRF